MIETPIDISELFKISQGKDLDLDLKESYLEIRLISMPSQSTPTFHSIQTTLLGPKDIILLVPLEMDSKLTTSHEVHGVDLHQERRRIDCPNSLPQKHN